MDIDNIAHSSQQHTSVLDGIKSRTTNWTPSSPILAEDFLPTVEEKKQDSFIATGPEKALHQGNLLKFAENLPKGLKEPLFSTTGKNSKNMKHPDASFTSEYRFRHIVPFLYTGNYLSEPDKRKLESRCPQARTFSSLWNTYGAIDTTSMQNATAYLYVLPHEHHRCSPRSTIRLR